MLRSSLAPWVGIPQKPSRAAVVDIDALQIVRSPLLCSLFVAQDEKNRYAIVEAELARATEVSASTAERASKRGLDAASSEEHEA